MDRMHALGNRPCCDCAMPAKVSGCSHDSRACLDGHDGLQDHRPGLVEALAERVLCGKLERHFVTVDRVRHAVRQRNPDALPGTAHGGSGALVCAAC